jgi:hypothetical protein
MVVVMHATILIEFGQRHLILFSNVDILPGIDLCNSGMVATWVLVSLLIYFSFRKNASYNIVRLYNKCAQPSIYVEEVDYYYIDCLFLYGKEC